MSTRRRVEVVSREERQVLAEAGRAIRADDAARRRRGFPKRLPCLRCGRRRWSHSPSDRLHDACRKSAAELDGKFVEDASARPPTASR